jgi:hypothetical protein
MGRCLNRRYSLYRSNSSLTSETAWCLLHSTKSLSIEGLGNELMSSKGLFFVFFDSSSSPLSGQSLIH